MICHECTPIASGASRYGCIFAIAHRPHACSYIGHTARSSSFIHVTVSELRPLAALMLASRWSAAHSRRSRRRFTCSSTQNSGSTYDQCQPAEPRK